MTLKVIEAGTLFVVAAAAAVPWHEVGLLLPPPLVLSVAIGAGVAVVCIPAERRSVGFSITTALAGMGLGLFATEWVLEVCNIRTAAAAKAIAGFIGMAGLPLCGMILRLVDNATNNPQSWIGRFFSALTFAKQDKQDDAKA